jgi:hypothetical protein
MLKLFEMGRSHMAVLMQLKKEAAQRRRKQKWVPRGGALRRRSCACWAVLAALAAALSLS